MDLNPRGRKCTDVMLSPFANCRQRLKVKFVDVYFSLKNIYKRASLSYVTYIFLAAGIPKTQDKLYFI